MLVQARRGQSLTPRRGNPVRCGGNTNAACPYRAFDSYSQQRSRRLTYLFHRPFSTCSIGGAVLHNLSLDGSMRDRPSVQCYTQSAGSPELSEHADSETDGSRKVFERINSLTKWIVSFAAFLTLALRHDVYVAWALLCSIFSVIVCKVLKAALNHERPQSVALKKADPGMPSSHANSLAYLSTYASLAILAAWEYCTTAIAVASTLIPLAMFLTWLRVKCKYHTAPQVVVGFALGTIQAAFWSHVGSACVLPLVESGNQGLERGIYVACGVFLTAFAWTNLREKTRGFGR